MVLDILEVQDIINNNMHLDDDKIFESYEKKQKSTVGQITLFNIMNKYFEKDTRVREDDDVNYAGFIDDIEEKIIFKKLLTLPQVYQEIDRWNQELPESEYSEEFLPINKYYMYLELVRRRGEDVDKIAQEYEPKDEEGTLMHHMKDLGIIPASSSVTLPTHTTVESKQ